MTKHHISSIRFNLRIFVILILLTIVTTASDYVNLGPFNLLLALIIASTKAMLVILYFMHLRWSPKLSWAFMGLSFFFLALMIGMTFDDFATRGWLYVPQGWSPLYFNH
jgi:cytochrome c oxidase subunit 4